MKTCKTIPLPQPSQPNEQVKEYLDAFGKGGRLVMHSEKSWRIVRPDGQKSPKFASRKEAVAEAKRQLAKDKGNLFIFDKSGRLVSCQSQDASDGTCSRIKAFFQNIRFG